MVTKSPVSLLLLVLIIALLLGACVGQAKPKPVEPVEGLPRGSQGFPWWNDTVFYEIFVRSFYDSNGDGIGDLNGITEKLDYLNDGNPATNDDLGVTGVWLMPIYPSPSYHGYDTTDYYTVNPDYGSLDDLRHLLDEAHKRGIRVILDLMLNHTSDQHPWFQAAKDPNSPYHDWYIWSDTDPGYLGPFGEKVWYPDGNGEFYYAIFSSGMPDLNYNNPAVRSEMENVTRFWLENVKVDGFRLDGARYLLEQGPLQADTTATHDWFRQYRDFYKGLQPQAMTVGEVWTSSSTVASYVQGDQLDMAFDFDLASAFISAGKVSNSQKALNQMMDDGKAFPDFRMATFLSNHDMDRAMSQLHGDVEKAKNAAVLLLTSPGAPFIYYGEEIGMTGTKPDEIIRSPMQWSDSAQAGFTTATPWEALRPDYDQRNVAVESSDPNSLLSTYRSLIRLRNQHLALRVGEATRIDSGQFSLYALLRSSKAEKILVLVNLGNKTLEDYSLSLEAGPLSGSYRVLSLLDSQTFPDLTANGEGGFDSYQPLPSFPPDTRIILQLQPK